MVACTANQRSYHRSEKIYNNQAGCDSRRHPIERSAARDHRWPIIDSYMTLVNSNISVPERRGNLRRRRHQGIGANVTIGNQDS